MDYTMWFAIWAIFWALIGRMIGRGKGRALAGGLLGTFLGPIGVIIALFLKPDKENIEKEALKSGEEKKCPYCAELVKSEAIVCRHCGKDLPRDETNTVKEREPLEICVKCGKQSEKKFNVCEHCGSLKH